MRNGKTEIELCARMKHGFTETRHHGLDAPLFPKPESFYPLPNDPFHRPVTGQTSQLIWLDCCFLS